MYPFQAFRLHQYHPRPGSRKMKCVYNILRLLLLFTSMSEFSSALSSSYKAPLLMRKLFMSCLLKSSIQFRWKRMLSKDVAGRTSIDTDQRENVQLTLYWSKIMNTEDSNGETTHILSPDTALKCLQLHLIVSKVIINIPFTRGRIVLICFIF